MNTTTKEARADLIEEGHEEEAIDAYIALGIGDEDLSNFEEAYVGEYASDEAFTQELLEEVGDIPQDLPTYVHIDWEATARDIMYDYSEEEGYYFRNL